MYFHEEQRFRQPWLWAVLAAVLAIELRRTFRAGLAGLRRDPLGAGTSAVAAAGSLLFFALAKLVVRLDSRCLYVRFYPFRGREIPLDEISGWEARAYEPLLEYGGWGIRSGSRGRAYAVGGNRGVRLRLTGGREVLVGLGRAEELSGAISRAKGGREPSGEE